MKTAGGYAYDNLLPRRLKPSKAQLRADLRLLAEIDKARKETRDRGIRRALEADWLCDDEIACEFGVDIASVRRIREEIELPRTARWGGIDKRG